MSNESLKQALLKAGELVAVQDFAHQLHGMHENALKALAQIERINPVDVYYIDKRDTLDRLKRNIRAMEFLLSTAYDGSRFIHDEIHQIFLAMDALEEQEQAHHKEIIRREHEYAVRKKQNARARAKKNAGAQ